MTLVFPTSKDDGLNAKRGAHFGKANFYTVVTLKDNAVASVAVHKNQGHTTGSCGNAVANIQALGADALIVGGIGGNPLKRFLEVGVDVYHDEKNATVQEALEDFLSGKTPKIDPNHTCTHHH